MGRVDEFDETSQGGVDGFDVREVFTMQIYVRYLYMY